MKILNSFTSTLALATALAFSSGCATRQSAPKKILFFSKSSGFEHDTIKVKGLQPSAAEIILTQLGKSNNFDFTFSKDGTLFTPENIAKYDAFFFYTTGDLTTPGTDQMPPMTKEGKAAFLEAIQNGKGFIATHSATDTFHSPSDKDLKAAGITPGGDNRDPYIKMIGGEFSGHGSQQKGHQICVDKSFPGMDGFPDDFGPFEEWYTFRNYSANLHVLLMQDTSGMDKVANKLYDRPNYPSTWAQQYGKGRAFYTSMGHRSDMWSNPEFQKVLIGGINWAVGNVDADVTPNIEKVAPEAVVFPKN
jgi:uncharacterized protein